MAINRNLSILAQGASASGNLLNYAGANKIINGDMAIDQRNAGASVTPTGNAYTLDRWFANFNVSSKLSVQQKSDGTSTAGAFYARLTSLSAYSAGASDIFAFSQPVEGLNCIDLLWGTASAKSVTISAWVRSSLTGTFGGSVGNSAGNRSYPFTYSIAAANTWTLISVTIPGDTTGTWLTTNGIGLYLYMGVGVGTTKSGTAGAWAGADYRSATGAVSVVATNGATWDITGVKLEVGTVATPFVPDDYAVSLQKCRRYYYQVNGTSGASNRFGLGIVVATTIGQGIIISGLGSMRTDPSVSGNNVDLYDATAAPTVTAFYLTANNGGVAPTFQFNTSVASLTVGRAVMALFNSTSGKLLIDAEL
jgi:hypothetical protein